MDPTQGQAVEEHSELTPEQIAAEAAADADFEAAFTNARSEELGTEGTTSSSTSDAAAPAPGGQEHGGTNPDQLDTDPETGTPPADGGTAATAEDEDAPVTITRRQLAELVGVRDTVAALQAELRQTVDSTNGRFGSIQQTLKQVKEQAVNGIRPSFAQMEALEEAFPELAEVMKRDLERAFGAGNATQPGSEGAKNEGDDIQLDDDSGASGAPAPGAAPAVNPLEAPEVRQALREANLAVVDAKHEGWRALPKTPEWQEWQNQLPATARELLRTTGDPATMIDAISDFKGWMGQRAAAASASNQRGKRLEHAVPATNGTAAVRSTVTDDDAFEDGFKSARPR